MAELTTRDNQLWSEIADWQGELHGYKVVRLKSLPACYQLWKDGAEEPYLVTLAAHGWTCSCPAYEFREARNRVTYPHTCKHCVAVRDSIHPVVEAIRAAALEE